MRISDWSSDVCSSDLERPTAPAAAPSQSVRTQNAVWKRLAALLPQPGEFAVLPGSAQIGRASCRERVCSVRVDLGGRRIIKTNKNIAHIILSQRKYNTSKRI